MTLEEIGLAWNSFFYDPIPVQTIAVFRICFGLLLLVDALNTFANAEPYLGPKGLLEYRRFFKQSHGRAFSLFVFFPPTMRSVYWILCLHFVGVTMMTVGLFTKVSTLLAFVTVRSIVTRSSALCNGGDNVANIMCFLLVFAPAGHAYSLDAVWFHAPQAPGTESLQHAPWALRLMQIQVSIIYLNTVYWKLKGTTWRNGTAVYYAATHSIYRKFSIPGLLLKKPCVQGCGSRTSVPGSSPWVSFCTWVPTIC